MELISVITPCKNSVRTIERTILSVKNQSFKNYEHIIVDGCSTDGTSELIRKYEVADSRIKHICRTDRSMTEAINNGISVSNGHVIGTLNSDDQYLPNTLMTVNTIFAHPEVDWIVGNTKYINEYGSELYRERPYMCSWKLAWEVMGCLTPESSTFFRADLLKSAGNFNERCKYTQDLELYFRLLEHVRPNHVNDYLSCFTISNETLSSTVWDKMAEEVDQYIQNRFLRKYFGGSQLGSLIRVISGQRIYTYNGIRRQIGRWVRL